MSLLKTTRVIDYAQNKITNFVCKMSLSLTTKDRCINNNNKSSRQNGTDNRRTNFAWFQPTSEWGGAQDNFPKRTENCPPRPGYPEIQILTSKNTKI